MRYRSPKSGAPAARPVDRGELIMAVRHLGKKMELAEVERRAI
jgi:hypothetical protein